MLKNLRLDNFKAFEAFQLSLKGDSYLVGPNNAGKSTLVAAMRASARLLRHAKSRSPDVAHSDRGVTYRGYSIGGHTSGLVEENLRHEFRQQETRLSVSFDSGAKLTAVWPPDASESLGPFDEDQAQPFFYLTVEGSRSPSRPADVRRAFPNIAVIPALTPVEHDEDVLTEEHLRRAVESPLVSRHFRNHLHSLDTAGELDNFREFAQPWVPEVAIDRLVVRYEPGLGRQLDLIYTEPGRRAEKEVFWAGDGIQVWLQILLHVYRNRDADVLILDEPDVFLHSDLQRRMVRLLDEVQPQTITATHSPEMLGEAAPEAVIWVDKSRRRAVRNPKPELMDQLMDTMGTQFNLRLAKALRSRVVLFVEGRDMKILTSIAKTLGLDRLATEAGIAVVPLGGFSNWEHVEPFSWLVANFLEQAVETVVILDRDYRSSVESDAVVERLRNLGIRGHVWSRKEIESYLLVESAISRLAGCTLAEARSFLEAASDSLRPDVFSRCLAAAQRRSEQRLSSETVIHDFTLDFEGHWTSLQWRLEVCPAKRVISEVNKLLSSNGYRPISARRLASGLRQNEIDDEVSGLLTDIESML